MRYTSLFVLAAPLVAYAAPAKRAASAADVLVLQFADVLEQFESGFYKAGISKFQEADFSNAGFTSPALVAQQLSTLQSDEATHSTVLQATLKTLGANPITNCQFSFDQALPDVATMAATARVVEFLGVSAYLGGATLIDDPVLLDAAGSILSVEARHSTVLNILSGSGTAVPAAFDIPFTPSEVLAVASPFISGCDLGIPANPSLSITNTGAVGPGTTLTFASSAISGATDGLFCQMLIGGAPFSISLPFNQCVVPDGINGPVAIFITSDNTPLANNVRDRATDKLVAGPLIAMIDTQVDMIAQLARTGSATASSGATTTAAAPSATASSAAPPAGNAASSGAVSSTPNLTTGPSQDGHITIDGWSNLPGGASSQSGASSPSAGAVGNSAASPPSSGPILSTGPSQDGHITIDGWTGL